MIFLRYLLQTIETIVLWYYVYWTRRMGGALISGSMVEEIDAICAKYDFIQLKPT